jgi:putative redox protein
MGKRGARPDRAVARGVRRGEASPTPQRAASGPVNRVVVVWQGDQRFDAGRPGAPGSRLDGTNETGQSPVDALLSALAACSGVDVVEILAKRRTPAAHFEIHVAATRRAEHPRRVLRFDIDYLIDGPGIDRSQTERAIKLTIEKYCTVAASLNPDIVIETTLTLNGKTGHPARQPILG